MLRQVFFIIAVGGISLWLLFLPGKGESGSPSLPLPGCPPLPEQGPKNTVSLYVAKALDVAGVVCVRMINGFPVGIGHKGFRLQRWETGRLWGVWGKGFRDFEPGQYRAEGYIAPVGGGLLVDAEGVTDWRLPRSGQPAPAGRYRVCLSYLLPDQEKYQEVCSEEFLLP